MARKHKGESTKLTPKGGQELSPEQRKAHAEMEKQAADLINAFTTADKQLTVWCVKLADLKDEVIAVRNYFTSHVRGSVTVAGCSSFKAFCKERLNRSKQAVYKLIGIKGEVERAEAENADEKDGASKPDPQEQPSDQEQGEEGDEEESGSFSDNDRYRFVADCANDVIAKVEAGEDAKPEIAALKAAIGIAPPSKVPFGDLETTVLLIDLVTVGRQELANTLASCGEDVPEPMRRVVTSLINRFLKIEQKMKQETRLETPCQAHDAYDVMDSLQEKLVDEPKAGDAGNGANGGPTETSASAPAPADEPEPTLNVVSEEFIKGYLKRMPHAQSSRLIGQYRALFPKLEPPFPKGSYYMYQGSSDSSWYVCQLAGKGRGGHENIIATYEQNQKEDALTFLKGLVKDNATLGTRDSKQPTKKRARSSKTRVSKATRESVAGIGAPVAEVPPDTPPVAGNQDDLPALERAGELRQLPPPAGERDSSHVIYTPAGRAREYAALACNLYRGCDHKCSYCYAPSATQKTRNMFSVPQLRAGDFLERLKKEAAEFKPGDPILLCFTTDPYCKFDEAEQITRYALHILHHYGHSVHILTKGGSRALRDLDLMTKDDAFGSTLTFLDPVKSAEWEPGAALPDDRIATLKKFHHKGVPTFVSLEPVIDPAETLEIIRRTHKFVDFFKVGKWNHDKRADAIDWAKFVAEAVALLESLGAKYLIKDDLKAYLPVAKVPVESPTPEPEPRIRYFIKHIPEADWGIWEDPQKPGAGALGFYDTQEEAEAEVQRLMKAE